MSILYLVRHGPTHVKGLVGWTDVDVDLSDRQKINRLDEHLPDVPIISSDLQRAVKTADAIAQNRHRLPHQENLREFNFGDWEGLSGADVVEKHPDLSRAYWDDPGPHAPPNGESWNAVSARASAAIDQLAEAHGDMIVVAHMGMILTQLARAGAIPPRSALSFKIDNFSLTKIERLDGGHWRILGVNHIC
ncbi:MAG: histidine phosphatase family protein [Pseudomonadota bacterium]